MSNKNNFAADSHDFMDVFLSGVARHIARLAAVAIDEIEPALPDVQINAYIVRIANDCDGRVIHKRAVPAVSAADAIQSAVRKIYDKDAVFIDDETHSGDRANGFVIVPDISLGKRSMSGRIRVLVEEAQTSVSLGDVTIRAFDDTRSVELVSAIDEAKCLIEEMGYTISTEGDISTGIDRFCIHANRAGERRRSLEITRKKVPGRRGRLEAQEAIAHGLSNMAEILS